MSTQSLHRFWGFMKLEHSQTFCHEIRLENTWIRRVFHALGFTHWSALPIDPDLIKCRIRVLYPTLYLYIGIICSAVFYFNVENLLGYQSIIEASQGRNTKFLHILTHFLSVIHVSHFYTHRMQSRIMGLQLITADNELVMGSPVHHRATATQLDIKKGLFQDWV